MLSVARGAEWGVEGKCKEQNCLLRARLEQAISRLLGECVTNFANEALHETRMSVHILYIAYRRPNLSAGPSDMFNFVNL